MWGPKQEKAIPRLELRSPSSHKYTTGNPPKGLKGYTLSSSNSTTYNCRARPDRPTSHRSVLRDPTLGENTDSANVTEYILHTLQEWLALFLRLLLPADTRAVSGVEKDRWKLRRPDPSS